MYQIIIKKTALKELSLLPLVAIKEITKNIETLGINPRPIGCKKLKSNVNLWRIRVGTYRVIYNIEDFVKIVNVHNIGHRKNVYD